MSLGEYVGGAAFFLATYGSVSVAALIVLRRRLSHLPGAPSLLALAVMGTAAIVAVHLLPGVLGVLSRTSVLVCALAVVSFTALLVRDQEPGADRAWGPHPPERRAAWLLAGVAGGTLLAWTAAAAWTDAALPSTDIDTLTFHTPNVAKWVQSGSFWRVDQFSPLLANGNYPQNGDVVFLSALLPWKSDAFARLLGIPFLAVASLAVYAIARELQAPRTMATMFALVFATLPAALFATHEGAKTDTVMLATFGAGVLFLMRHFRTGRRSELILAGLGLGLAFGTKWYGLTSVVAVLVLWSVVWTVAGRSPRALLGNIAVVGCVVAAAGGFWLLRNLVVSGNPVLPTRVGIGDATLFDASRDFIRECGGFTIASYVAHASIWSEFILPAFRENYGIPGLALGAGVLVAIAQVVRAGALHRLETRFHVRLLVLAILALALAFVYSITPYSAFGARNEPTLVGANARWLLPALLVAAAVSAAAAGRLGRVGSTVAALIGIAAVADGIRRGFSIPRSDVAVAAGLLAAGALAGFAVVTRVRAMRLQVTLLAVPALAALLVAGHLRQREFLEARYRDGDPVISYFARQAADGHRVGLAGVFSVEGLSPVLPAFGPRLGNEVSYVGHEVKGQLREYDTYEGFRTAVRRRGFDLLLLGKGDYPGCEVPGAARREAAWARASGFRQLAESDRMYLFTRGSPR